MTSSAGECRVIKVALKNWVDCDKFSRTSHCHCRPQMANVYNIELEFRDRKGVAGRLGESLEEKLAPRHPDAIVPLKTLALPADGSAVRGGRGRGLGTSSSIRMNLSRVAVDVVAGEQFFICHPPPTQHHHRSKDNARPGGWMTHLGTWAPELPAPSFSTDFWRWPSCMQTIAWSPLSGSHCFHVPVTLTPAEDCSCQHWPGQLPESPIQTRSLKVPSCSGWPRVCCLFFFSFH